MERQIGKDVHLKQDATGTRTYILKWRSSTSSYHCRIELHFRCYLGRAAVLAWWRIVSRNKKKSTWRA